MFTPNTVPLSLSSLLYVKLYFLAGKTENSPLRIILSPYRFINIFQDYTEIFNGIQMEALKPITL